MNHERHGFESFTRRDLEAFGIEYRISEDLIRKGETIQGLLRRGRLFERLGLFRWAIDCYRKGIQTVSPCPEIILELALLYGRIGLFYSEKKFLCALGNRTDILDRVRFLEEQYPNHSVTFYLPCYNVETYIAPTIEAVLSQSYEIEAFLIIDDGSTDASAAIAGRYPVRIVAHDRNRGLAAARNTAIGIAASEFLATVDTDALPDTYWLEKLIIALNDGKLAGAGGRLIEKYTATAADRWRQVRMAQHHGDEIRDGVPLFGSNTVFRLDALRAVGGYDERLRTNFEDMELSSKLRNRGFTTRYLPDAVCHHCRKDTLLSVVDTCYNWRKPVFELNGAFKTPESLAEKGVNDILTNCADIAQLLRNGQSEILYPSFLGCIRSVFKDLAAYCKESPGYERWCTFKASYITLIYLLHESEGIGEDLLHAVLGDISDLASVLNRFNEKDYLPQLNRAVLEEIGKEKDLHRVLNVFQAGAGGNLAYVQRIFSKMSDLFRLEPLVYKMTQVSARRIRHEEANSPYAPEKRVMLLNAPWNPGGRRGVRAGSRWPFTGTKCADTARGYTPYPFFMGYLCSLLREKGIENVVVDGIAEDLTDMEFLERVAGFGPEIIVMETATPSILTDTLWLFRLKERLPQTTAIWVGAHASALGERIMAENPLLDFIVRGEYEQAAAELIGCLLENKSLNHVGGLIRRREDGRIVASERPPLVCLDDLPEPERLTLPIYKYNDLFAGMQYPCLQLHASRGCPFGCIYCVWPQVLYGGKNYRVRDPHRVVDEIEKAVAEYGFRSFYFDDDTFNIGKDRITIICREIVRRNLNIPWGAMARADTSDFETLQTMREAGLVGIKFGVESGEQCLVDAAGKGLDLGKVERAVGWCKQLGIHTHLTFTFGLPGETPETIRKTIDFSKRMDPDTIQFSITTPFPGTRYFSLLKQDGNLLTEEWEKFDGALHTVIRSGALGREDLELAVRRANLEFIQQKQRKKQ